MQYRSGSTKDRDVYLKLPKLNCMKCFYKSKQRWCTLEIEESKLITNITSVTRRVFKGLWRFGKYCFGGKETGKVNQNVDENLDCDCKSIAIYFCSKEETYQHRELTLSSEWKVRRSNLRLRDKIVIPIDDKTDTCTGTLTIKPMTFTPKTVPVTQQCIGLKMDNKMIFLLKAKLEDGQTDATDQYELAESVQRFWKALINGFNTAISTHKTKNQKDNWKKLKCVQYRNYKHDRFNTGSRENAYEELD